MENNLDSNSDFTYEKFGQEQASESLPIVLPSGTIFVSNVNGLAGNITFVGGTSGFSYSPAGATITLVSPLTTKGDLYTRDGSNGMRLAVGANNARLAADSSAATGLAWIAATTGWSNWTGTADRTAHATYSGTASVGYVQAELQAVMDKLKEITEAYKALVDDLKTQKILNA